MSTTLLRRFFGSIMLLALLVLGARPAQATHLLGGEMSYRYLDANGTTNAPFRYEITVTIYSNGLNGVAAPPNNAPVSIFNRTTGANIGNYNPVRIGPLGQPVTPHIPAGCAIIGPSQPFYLCRYVQIVNVAFAPDGYYAVFTLGARNNDIDNINNPGGQNLTLSVSMVTPLIYNRSPVFSDTAVAIVCQNDTTLALNNAFDADGDRLVYSFGTPYGGGLPTVTPTVPPTFTFTNVPYKAGFSVTAPFGQGAGNFALLNASTGIARYGGTTLGKYVVAVDVSEYRTINGREVLIGITRRDLQLVVATCPTTPPPVIPTIGVPRNYTIEEGQSLSFPISANQSNNHPLALTVNSALLDGSGPFNTTFNGSTGTVQPGNPTGTATATGTGTVTGTFVYNSACGDGRANPYDVSVRVQDNGCGGKQAVDLFQITVTRAAGPTAITGAATVCDPGTVRTYTATGASPTSYRWRIRGGTITGGQGTSAVTVTWANAVNTGTLSVRGISSYGCPSDSVVQNVDIRPLPALTVTPTAPSICLGASTTLTVTGQAGLTYTWTGGGISSTSSTVTVSPTATTTYTVTGTDGTCTTSASVTVSVTPPPVANPGPARSVCSGVASAPLGAPAIVGATYLWSPATGLSSATVAQPTVTLSNTTGAPIVQTYTLTVTVNGSCTSVGTVNITVNPAAVADAGPARATCASVASPTLGAPALAGYTYSWSPATGLSSATVAQPTVTLPNTGTAPITQTYTVTATNAQGCSATSTVVVTVNPAAVATPGPAVSFCSGGSATLGTAPIAGTTYSWSPATGLSSTSVANPTVTGTNITGTPITTTYTLTATSANGCVATATVLVTINPAAVANAGAAVSFCSGGSATLGGGTAVAGTTYAWSPATGLSSASVLNPTVTLPNTTGANIAPTYTLTATTANGCTATATVTATVLPAAIATPGPAVSFCSGGSATLGTAPVAGTTYSWSPATGLSSTTAANPTVTGTNTTGAPIVTTYTLTATTANNCTTTATVVVTINPAAVANAGPAKSTCSNVGVAIGSGTAVAGTTYSWSPATGLSSASVLNPTVTLTNATGAPITQTYTLTATTANGCTANATVIVTINPAAVADAGLAKSTCSNVGVAIGSGTAVAGTTYAWLPATGLSSASVLNPTVTLPNTGTANITQTYTLTATTANGCTATATVLVTVFPAATALAGANQSVCSGLSVTLGAAPVTGYTYSWSPAIGLSSATVANPTFSQTNTTSAPITTNYTLTATTANGCTASGTVAVTVNPAAVANAGPAAAVCDGKRITLGTPALTGYTYSWSPATNLSSATAAQPVLTGVNPGTTPLTQTYTLTATTANGCVNTSSVTVTINPRPGSSAITGPVSVCPTVTGIAYSVVNPVGTAFTWLINGGTIASGQGTPAITVNWGVASTGGFVKVFSLNTQGCSSDTTTLPVIINQQLQTVRPTGPGDILAVAPLPRSVCQADGPYTYTSGVFANGSSYSWVITGGTQVSTFQNTVTVQWDPVTTPTTGTIVVTQTSNPAGGICRGTSQALQVLINPSPLPNLAITSPVRVCQTNGPVTFALPGGFPGSTYVFQLSGTTLAGTGSTRVLNTLPAPGTYSLTVRETTSAGCTGPLYTTPFTVSPTPVAPTISGSGFVCDVSVTQQYTIANPTAGATYQWTVVGGNITAGGTGSQITVKFNPAGPYTVSAAEVSASPALCAGPAATRTITFDSPGVSLTLASVDPASSNNRIILTLSASNSGSTPNPIRILRRVAGVGAFTQLATVPVGSTTYTDNNAVDATGNSYEYQLGLTNGCGTNLTSTLAQTIRLQATNTTGQGGFDQGQTTLSWNAYVGFPVTEYRIYRRSDNGTADLLVPAPVITTSGNTLTATVPNAAAGSAAGAGFQQNFRVVAVSSGATPRLSYSNEVGVSFDNNVKTYNIITPNHDGLNDVLVIDNIQLYPGNTFTVFNRWGKEVYKTTNYQNTFGQDDNVAAGTYFYLLKLPDGSSKKAWFEVVK